MCNRYLSPEDGDMERYWNLRPANAWRIAEVFPRAPAPCICPPLIRFGHASA